MSLVIDHYTQNSCFIIMNKLQRKFLAFFLIYCSAITNNTSFINFMWCLVFNSSHPYTLKSHVKLSRYFEDISIKIYYFVYHSNKNRYTIAPYTK